MSINIKELRALLASITGLLEYIKELRQQYPRLGKDKIKPFLDEFCSQNCLKTIHASTIGRIIKKKNFFFHPKKITHFGKIVKTEYKKKLRRKGYQIAYPGDLLQIDSITRFKDGVKRYLLTAIDCKGEFSFAYGYSSNNNIPPLKYIINTFGFSNMLWTYTRD